MLTERMFVPSNSGSYWSIFHLGRNAPITLTRSGANLARQSWMPPMYQLYKLVLPWDWLRLNIWCFQKILCYIRLSSPFTSFILASIYIVLLNCFSFIIIISQSLFNPYHNFCQQMLIFMQLLSKSSFEIGS